MRVYDTGLNGEQQAEKYLQALGYETVCRRWRAGSGSFLPTARQYCCMMVFVFFIRTIPPSAAGTRRRSRRIRPVSAADTRALRP